MTELDMYKRGFWTVVAVCLLQTAVWIYDGFVIDGLRSKLNDARQQIRKTEKVYEFRVGRGH